MADPQKHRLDPEDYVKEVAGIQKIMANEKEMTDVILLCGEKKIPAHKLILAGASPYFRTMFRNECKETVENVVELPTVTENTLTIILDFIYNIGSKEICWKSVEETVDVLEAAHLFEMKPLFVICCRQLVKNLTRENCLQFWKLGNLYEDEFFRSQSFQFVKNNLDKLVKDETLLQMNASDFKLLLTQMKVATLPQECFMNSVSEWILENRSERQSLIPLLNEKNLSKKIIKSFLEKNALSEINIKFLEQLCETDWQTEQCEKSVELDVPLSSLKMLLCGKVDKQMAYQIVDFSGRSSELKILPFTENDLNETAVAVYKTKLYILTMKNTKKIPFYECCLESGKIFLRKPWTNEINLNGNRFERGIVIEDFFYVRGCRYERNVLKPFLKRYNILNDTWYDLTYLVADFLEISFDLKFETELLLIGKNTEDQYSYMIIYKKQHEYVFKALPICGSFSLKQAFYYNNELFLISDEELIVHNLLYYSSELRYNSYKPECSLYFHNFSSFNCAVKMNDCRSESEWSHRLVNLNNGQVITEIIVNNSFKLCPADAFVSDISI